MRKKTYIEKIKNTILNRVQFHAPIVFDDYIDFKSLEEHLVDIKKPIFKYEKPLNNNIIRAFKSALREKEFNLLVPKNCLNNNIQLKNLQRVPQVVFFDPPHEKKSFMESINKLNINYASASNYDMKFRDRFFKVNSKILNPHFEEFSLKEFCVVDEIFVDYCEFVLNGSNFFCQFQNKSSNVRRVEFELNVPLENGYYLFKRQNKNVMIENLLTKKKKFLSYLCRNARFSFSDVDGLENSVFCCVNVKVAVTLSAGQSGFLFFNLGDEIVPIKNIGQVFEWKNLARKKSYEIFNLQVKTRNPQFDYFFNKILPMRAWINWMNNVPDRSYEQKYKLYKRLFVREDSNSSYERIRLNLVNFKEIGIKEFGIFNGEYFKKVIVIKGGEKFLRVGKTFFYNINGITKYSLKSKEAISVCFGT